MPLEGPQVRRWLQEERQLCRREHVCGKQQRHHLRWPLRAARSFCPLEKSLWIFSPIDSKLHKHQPVELPTRKLPRFLRHPNYTGWLGYIGDYTTQLYRDYNKPLYIRIPTSQDLLHHFGAKSFQVNEKVAATKTNVVTVLLTRPSPRIHHPQEKNEGNAEKKVGP